MLKLVHIKNISESDTPSFTTQTEQENYFDNLVGITITDGWYPPYYENEIKFDTNDVSFDSNYNYLILYYKNRRYYYFIDNMTYVNEGVIAIHIIMDTIQTFMFGATLSDVVIERKFINRWNTSDDTINREYIRENVSNSDLFYNETFEYETGNVPMMLIKSLKDVVIGGNVFPVLDTGDNRQANQGKVFAATYCNFNGQHYQDNATSIFMPIGQTSIRYATDFNPSASGYREYTLPTSYCDTRYLFWSGTLNNNDFRDAYYIPFNPLENSSESGSITRVSSYNYIWDVRFARSIRIVGLSKGLLEDDYYALAINPSVLNGQVMRYFTYNWIERNHSITCNRASFTPNESEYTDFKPNYVPALIDENYIKIEYGEVSLFTSYPLSKAISANLVCCKAASLADGSRHYYIHGYDINEDIYKTLVSSDYGISIDLVSDYWQNYRAQNKGRLLSSIASIGIGLAVGYATKNVKAGFIAKDLSQAALKPNYMDFRTNPLRYKSKGARKIGYSINYEQTDIKNKAEETEQLDKLSTIANTASAINGIIGERANAYFMPNSSKSSGDFGSDIVGNKCRIYFRQEVVEDIEQVAQYYHRNGYLVNEYVKYELGLDALLNNNNTRAYYNIIKLSMCSVHLNTLEAQDIIEDIERRLQNGFRYWNLSSRISIGTFQYDNVEKEYLQ